MLRSNWLQAWIFPSHHDSNKNPSLSASFRSSGLLFPERVHKVAHSSGSLPHFNRRVIPSSLSSPNATGIASPTYSKLHKVYLLHRYLFNNDFLDLVSTWIIAKLFLYLLCITVLHRGLWSQQARVNLSVMNTTTGMVPPSEFWGNGCRETGRGWRWGSWGRVQTGCPAHGTWGLNKAWDLLSLLPWRVHLWAILRHSGKGHDWPTKCGPLVQWQPLA